MKKQTLRSSHHSVYKLLYHIVLVTKYRRKALTTNILARMKDHFGRICENSGGELVEFNGESDHVHLLIDMPPNVAPSRWVNTLKTISSREIRKEFPDQLKRHYWKPVLWSRSYCVVSAGGAPLSAIKQYIENQGKKERG